MFYIIITSGLSFFAGIFLNYKKIDSLFYCFNLLEKKLRYIENMMHLNDNYQLANDKQHRLITERVINIEKILADSVIERIKQINNQDKIDALINNTAVTTDTGDVDIEAAIPTDLETDEYIKDFDNTTFSNQIVSEKRSSSGQLLELTKRIIFG